MILTRLSPLAPAWDGWESESGEAGDQLAWTGPRVVTPDLYCTHYVHCVQWTCCTLVHTGLYTIRGRLPWLMVAASLTWREREREAAVQESECVSGLQETQARLLSWGRALSAGWDLREATSCPPDSDNSDSGDCRVTPGRSYSRYKHPLC